MSYLKRPQGGENVIFFHADEQLYIGEIQGTHKIVWNGLIARRKKEEKDPFLTILAH